VFCRQQVAELAQQQSAFAEKGGRLVVVGNGQPEQLAALRSLTGYAGTLLTDPQREAFSFLGFQRTIGGVIKPQSLIRAIRSLSDGYRPGMMQGDALQLGGAVTITPDNHLSYSFKSTEAGEHPPVAALLASLDHR
jgi:hypothetical protein